MLRKKIDKFLETGLSILMGLMVVNVLWQIASRYIVNEPSGFTDELSRFMLIWIGLLGAAYASGKNMHVAIDLLAHRLSLKQRKIQLLLIKFLIFSFALTVLIFGGIRLVFISFHLGQLSSAMQVSLGYVYLVLPLSGLLICYYSFSDFIYISKRN